MECSPPCLPFRTELLLPPCQQRQWGGSSPGPQAQLRFEIGPLSPSPSRFQRAKLMEGRGNEELLTSPVGGDGGWASFPPRPQVRTAGAALALPGGLGSPPPPAPTPSLPGFEKGVPFTNFPFSFWRSVCSQSPRCFMSFRADLHVLPSV